AAAAGGAVDEVDALVAAAHALAGHLEDPELADGEQGGAGAVALHALAEAVFDVLAVAGVAHVDQVVDDDAAEVAELELAADLLDRLAVGLVGVGLGVAGIAHLAGVHVDGDQGLGLV